MLNIVFIKMYMVLFQIHPGDGLKLSKNAEATIAGAGKPTTNKFCGYGYRNNPKYRCIIK